MKKIIKKNIMNLLILIYLEFMLGLLLYDNYSRETILSVMIYAFFSSLIITFFTTIFSTTFCSSFPCFFSELCFGIRESNPFPNPDFFTAILPLLYVSLLLPEAGMLQHRLILNRILWSEVHNSALQPIWHFAE